MTAVSQRGVIPEWTVGDRLKKARALTGMTTRDFAEHIGTSQKTVTDAEGDKRGVPRKMLLNAWSLATGVPVEWLLTGTAANGPVDGGPLTGRELPDGGEKLRELTAKSRARAHGDSTNVYQAAA